MSSPSQDLAFTTAEVSSKLLPQLADLGNALSRIYRGTRNFFWPRIQVDHAMPKASEVVIGGLFPHTPLCPVVQLLDKPEQSKALGFFST